MLKIEWAITSYNRKIILYYSFNYLKVKKTVQHDYNIRGSIYRNV